MVMLGILIQRRVRGKVSVICTIMGLPFLGSTSARKPPAGDRGGDLKRFLMLSWSQSLQVTCWLPTLLVFAHSLVMRKPSAEARERIRFLWIVVRSEVGTLCRQKGWLVGTAPPASPTFSQALGLGVVPDDAHVGSKGPSHPKGSPRPKSHGDGCWNLRGDKPWCETLPHPAMTNSKKVVVSAQRDTPQPTNDRALSSDSSSGPSCKEGQRGAHPRPDLQKTHPAH